MANTITNIVPLLLAQGLMALRQNAIMTRVINRDYEGLAAQKGNVINVPIPSAVTATSVTPSSTPATNQDMSPTVALVTLDFWKEATFQLSDKDFVSVMNGTIPMQASEAIKALVNAVDQKIINLSVGIYGAAGTAGTSPFNGSLTAAANAMKLLNLQLAPLANRSAVLDPIAQANFVQNSQVLNPFAAGQRPLQALEEGTLGRILGIDWYMDQNVTTFTVGTAAASGYIASTVAGVAGQTTLNVINATASGNMAVGDIFTFTTSVDSKQQQYVIQTIVAVAATTAAIFTFQPPLTTAVATGSTLIFISVTYTANLAFHRDAFAWASRPLAEIQGLGNEMMSQTDPISGITLRLEVSRQYKQTTFSFDILGGAALVRPALAVKILG